MHFFVIQITYRLPKYHNKMNKKLKKVVSDYALIQFI